jgi:hypothetical protein
VTFGAALGEIRGHHLVGLELYRKDDSAGALVHAGHPIEEILSTVQGKIREKDAAAATALENALGEVRTAVQAKKSADDVSSAVDAATSAVEEAETAVVGDLRISDAYRGSVIAAILSTAAHEYEEAVQDGKLAELIEYQDGYGFVRIAKRLYAEIEGAVARAGAEEAEEIEEGFGRLEKALPSPAPPAKPASVEDVEKAAALVAAELKETVGAVVAAAEKPEEVVEHIEQILDHLLEEYEEGETEEAAELAAEVYLENYELIEADVIRLAKDVNAELEPILGSQLRARIRAKAPVSEIEQMVKRAKVLLAQALAALEKEK